LRIAPLGNRFETRFWFWRGFYDPSGRATSTGASRKPSTRKDVIMDTVMATTAQVYAHITKDPDVCGGKACIDGTRIRVMDIVCLHKEGYTPERMLNAFATASPLTLGQVHAALTYYYDHKGEIEASLAEDETLVAEHDRKRAEYLSRRR
jgi:uncharacterized protein (DUF433 family)